MIPAEKLVVHSFGLHLVEDFSAVQELIILSSYITFAPKKRVVLQMLRQLKENPYRVLENFLGHKVGGEIDKNLLEMDLKRVYASMFDTQVIKDVPIVKIVHGQVDSITPIEWGLKLHASIPQSQFFPVAGGHFDTIEEAHRLGFF